MTKTSEKIEKIIKELRKLERPVKQDVMWGQDMEKAIKSLRNCYYLCIAIDK